MDPLIYECENLEDYLPDINLFDSNDPNDPNDPNNPNEIIFPPDKPQINYKANIIDRIKYEMNLTEEEFNAFVIVLKEKKKKIEKEYERTVLTTQVKNDKRHCTICSRHFLSLTEEARIFEISFYYFTYGKKYDKRFVSRLHNRICESIGVNKMSREQSRSIRSYFQAFANSGFEIIQTAHKYCIKHPEFIEEIRLFKQK